MFSGLIAKLGHGAVKKLAKKLRWKVIGFILVISIALCAGIYVGCEIIIR